MMSTSIFSTEEVFSTVALLPPSAWALKGWEGGREGRGEEEVELLDEGLEGLEDLDIFLNDSVMSQTF